MLFFLNRKKIGGKVNKGHNPLIQDWTVLGMAVLKERSHELIAELVRRGADVNARNGLGYTPLHTAVTTGKPKAVAALLSEGNADPNIPNNAEVCPLQT